MPRSNRIASANYIYHVLNRSNERVPIFEGMGDYAWFESLLAEARQRIPLRILSYCLMPNHWHLVLWPREDDQLPKFMDWLTGTHAINWRMHRDNLGNGHVYQGRYKSFPIQDGSHFFTVCRYVERNALRANLVHRAENWRWSSLWRRVNGVDLESLDEWPNQRPDDWVARVNRSQTLAELKSLRTCVRRNRPYGELEWQQQTAIQLGLESTLQPAGRPHKSPIAS